MLQTLDFETLAATDHTFVVEALDSGGSMPPGLATVTVKIKVRKRLYLPPATSIAETHQLGHWAVYHSQANSIIQKEKCRSVAEDL